MYNKYYKTALQYAKQAIPIVTGISDALKFHNDNTDKNGIMNVPNFHHGVFRDMLEENNEHYDDKTLDHLSNKPAPFITDKPVTRKIRARSIPEDYFLWKGQSDPQHVEAIKDHLNTTEGFNTAVGHAHYVPEGAKAEFHPEDKYYTHPDHPDLLIHHDISKNRLGFLRPKQWDSDQLDSLQAGMDRANRINFAPIVYPTRRN